MSSRRPKTFAGLARQLGVEYCRGVTPSGHYCPETQHGLGAVTPDGTVHFADREMRWPGLVRFLKLVAISRDPSLNEEVPWARVYRMNMALKDISREANTRIPTKYLDMDRVFVRASVAPLDNSVPLRKQAFDWSRRKAGKTWA